MAIERLNSETANDSVNSVQPDSKPDSHDIEKKSRRRKKRRKARNETSTVIEAVMPVAESPQTLEGDAVMLWQRPEGEVSQKAPVVEATSVVETVESVPPPMPPDPVTYRQRFWSEQPLPEQYSPPQLEAEPMHTYIPHHAPETGRKTVQPVSVETHVANQPPETKPTAESVSKPSSERQLGKQELLKLAKDITIDGVRLKDVYNTNRIDEAGLRAVVDVYLRGGDIKQRLTQEIIAKEQSYERDPQLRHQRLDPEFGAKVRGSKAAQKVGNVLGQAKAIAGEQGAKLAATSQKSAKSASKVLASGAKQAQHDLIDNASTADWLSITAVVVVWSIILILWLG